MKKLSQLCFVLLLLSGVEASGQEVSETPDRRPNVFSLNLMEGGTIAGIHYERYLLNEPHYLLAFMIGGGMGMRGDISSFSRQSPNAQYLVNVSSRITFNIGGTRHFFESGLGGTIVNGDLFNSQIVYPLMGYRFQNYGKFNSCFRVFVQLPLLTPPDIEVTFIPMGISVGAAF